MSVQYQPTQVTYISDGINPTYSFLFKAQAADWIEVSIFDPDADPLVDAAIVPPANYGVTLNPTEGGSINFTGPVPAAGFEITIRLNADFTQELELDNNSPISLTQIEKSLDRLTMFCLQVKNELTRTVKLPYWFGQPPSTEPLVIELGIDDRLLVWQGGRIANSPYRFEDYYTAVQVDDLLAANLIAANAYTDAGLALKADVNHAHTLSALLQSGATLGQSIVWDGTNWVPTTPIVGVTDHGLLTGLADDDHTQYHNDARGDARYYTQAQITTLLAGKANSSHTHSLNDLTQTGALLGQVATWNGTNWAPQTSGTGVTDHGLLTGLGDDDHTQYHNDARGDARYYTQAQVTTFLATNATNDRARANHTGTQLAATISDFASTVLATAITGVSFVTTTAIVATDTILQAFGKLQGQINSHFGVGGTTHPNATTSVSGFMSGADKTKLDGVATNANNYTHPNHSGDVTSVGDGTQTIANDVVTNPKLANMATQTFKGRNTAGTGDPEDLTVTQATSMLDVFTSTLKGLAPASGGGTTNYLRADGTWASPAGGGPILLPEDTGPANPPNNTTLALSSRGRTIPPDLLPQYIDNFGRTYLLETNKFNKRVAKADPTLNGTTFQTFGGIALTATGTATANSISIATNLYASLPRVEAAVTTAAVGAVAGFRTAINWLRRGGGSVHYPYAGGFRLKLMFGLGRGTAATDASRRFFAGVADSTAAPTNVNPSTISNIIGIGYDDTDTNWQLMHRGAGAITKVDTGIAKAVGADNQGLYELEIFARTSNLSPENVIVSFKDMSTQLKKTPDFVQEITSNMPAETLFLGARVWATSGSVSSVMGVTLMDLTAEQELYYT